MKNVPGALDELYNGIAQCTKDCPLNKARKKLVRDKKGNWSAGIILVGEAPGREEIEQGTPFVGMAGENLGGFLAHAGLDREKVYITNVLRYRPTRNGRYATRSLR